ncbi:TPA: two-component system response regulator [Candidatus Sumerlaeota bacterium]|jgi:putative two-component system response regulator|nr:two-component system response regulator [Candidatus Sumerlaeota bacterium]
MKSRILFVDDDEGVLGGYRLAMRGERTNWDFEFATGVDEALRMACENLPDAVVSDYNMPEKNGFDLICEFRACNATKDIPITIVTGIGEESLKRRALDQGATDLLAKPVDASDLISRIRNMLKLKSYQDTIKQQNAELEQKVLERTAQLERSRLEIVWRLAMAGEYRDENTGNHVIRVGWFSRLLAEAIGCPLDFCRRLFLSSLLHDIGKIGIPDGILLKPASLEPGEWEIMKRHCLIGSRILRDTSLAFQNLAAEIVLEDTQTGTDENPFLEMASRIAMAHHEKWGGGGYPLGISGENIPLEARIVAVADVFDALSSPRPYKRAYNESEVLGIMRPQMGLHFDPLVFQAFLSHLSEFQEVLQRFPEVEESTPRIENIRVR